MGGAWSGARSRQLRRNVDGDVLLQNCSTGPAANGLVQAHDAEAAAPDGRSPEEEACLLPRLLFFWAFPVLWAGYQQGHTDLHDLPPLPMADRPEAVEAKVCGAWRERLQRQPGGERGAPPQLLPVLARLTGRLFLQALSCHGLMLCASYLQPVMLHRLLVQLGMPRNDEDVFWLTADAVGIALAVMLMWIFAEYAWIMYVRCDLRVQVALNHLTYRKSLYLSNGDSRYTIGDLQNHFSTDATKPMQNFMHNQHAQVLDAIVTIIVVMSHLIGLIGSAGVVALLTLVVFSPGQLLLTRRMKVMTRRIQKCRDTRGRLSSEFFSAMRVVKCFCLEGAALAQVGASRDEELKAQWEKRKIFPFNNFIASSASLFATTAAFTWLLLVLKQPPDPAVAFTVLSWNNLLKSSVMQLPNAINQLIDTHVSLQRIQKLLHTDTATDQWLDPLPLRSLQASGHAAESSSSRPEHGEASGADDFRLSACDLGWKVAGGHRGIQSLSLSVKQGELMLVCGSIGSGKSLVLEGLAGTRLPLAGECSRGGRRTAYVAQRPWLLNGTLAENVTFGQPFDPDRMARIVECCALGPDLQALPDGLETLVGEDGVQLSGGQKQRVSLARAIYSGAEVLLLDDVLSALDAHVGRHVWEQAICGELRGRTRVLATHQVQYCSCEEVDRILVLGKEGALEHFGTFAQLSGAGFNFGTVGSASKDAEEEGIADDPSQSESGKADAKQLASVASPPPSGRPGRGGELSAETRRLGSVQLRDFLAYAQACGGLRGFVTIAVLMVTYYGSLLASNLELAAWANTNQGNASGDPAEAQEESERHLTRYLLLSLLVGLSCLSFFFGIQLVALRGSRNLHRLLINSLLKTELRFFDLTPTGRVLNRCLKDMAQIDDNMPAACRMLFESLMSFVISLVILTLFAWEALFAIPPFALAYCRVMTIYRWPARDLKRLEGVSRSPAMSHFSDSIRGTSTIRAYQHDLRFMGQNLELCSRIQKTVYWFWVAQGWVSMVQEVTGTLLLAIIAGIIGYRASTGALSAGLAGLALSYAVSMPRDLMWLSRRLANLEVEFVSVERVLEYARLGPEDRAEASGAGGAAGLREAPCAICAENVWFRYAPESPWVLSGLSLSIARGARTAFVGRTGCGKSSFLSVLARLYPVSDSGGRLLVHGLDVMAVPLPALRKTVRVLLQDPIFFQGTVRSNLLCRPPQLVGAASGAPLADLEREDVALRRALTLAGLGARLESLPDGLDSRVEESGHNFSHGERQLLCLARALADPPSEAQGPEAAVLGPRVLLCDEPTASCDLATDEHIHGTLLRALPADWTLIVVCHRLHRIREFDDVFVLEKGAVAEHGAPASLLGKPPKAGSERGLLAAMCRQQGVA